MQLRHSPQKHKSDYRAPHPGAARVSAGRPDPAAAARCVYSGRDRLGSYRYRGGAWHAVDRLARAIGTYTSELEAANAVEAAARSAA
jgi:hypothetical protein